MIAFTGAKIKTKLLITLLISGVLSSTLLAKESQDTNRSATPTYAALPAKSGVELKKVEIDNLVADLEADVVATEKKAEASTIKAKATAGVAEAVTK